MASKSSPSASSLDLRVMVMTPLTHFAPWLAAVLVVTLAGYPGVVCITPLAWLLALRVGLTCAAQSASASRGRRLLEATLAGGLFGFLQGALFFVIVPRMGPIQASEQAGAILLSLAMVVGGMLAGAGLAAFSAYQVERRRGEE